MLRCAPLPSARDRDRLLDPWLDDYLMVVRHVLNEPTYLNSDTMHILAESVLRHEIPPLTILNRVVGWVLWQMQWDHRPPSDPIHAAAWRLSDSMHGPR